MAFVERTDVAVRDAGQQRLVARGDPPYLNCRVPGAEEFHSVLGNFPSTGDGRCGSRRRLRTAFSIQKVLTPCRIRLPLFVAKMESGRAGRARYEEET